MAVAQTTAKLGYNNTYAGTAAGSFSSTPTAGNTVIAVGYSNGDGVPIGLSVDDNQGNGAYTLVQGPEMANNSRCWIAYKTGISSSGTFTVTATASGSPRSMEFVLLEIPAADVSGGLDQSVIGGIASGAYALSTPVSNATASAFCVSALVLQAGSNAASPALTTAPSGYTNILDSNAAGSCEVTAAYRYAGAAAVETVTYPDYFSGSYNQSGVLLTFKTSGGSPTVSTVSSNSANEGASIVHTVTLSAAVSGSAAVYAITLAGGTATGGGTDYTSTLTNGMFSDGVTVSGGDITVPVGLSAFTVTVPTTSDLLPEATETYTLTIGGTAGTGSIVNMDPWGSRRSRTTFRPGDKGTFSFGLGRFFKSRRANTNNAPAGPTNTALVIQDATHGHTADNATLSTAGDTALVIQDSTHAHTTDGVNLTTGTVLVIQDATHAVSSDHTFLGGLMALANNILNFFRRRHRR